MTITPSSPAERAATVAAHRFGLGESTLQAIGDDAAGWLLQQIGPAETARGEGLLDTAQAVAHVRAEAEARRLARNPPPGMTAEQLLAGHYREVIAADARSRLLSAATARRPFAERLYLFWTNHFTVSLTKGSVRGLVGAFERDAIRPHIAGSFETLLRSATIHPAMLRYLDNQASAGPRSRVVERAARRAQAMQEGPRVTGLNENLAREILELHTLGVNGGYTQADVTAFAAVLTGWRLGNNDPVGDAPLFDPAWHEPGPKTVLGQRYPEGPDALPAVLRDLARHPGHGAVSRHQAGAPLLRRRSAGLPWSTAWPRATARAGANWRRCTAPSFAAPSPGRRCRPSSRRRKSLRCRARVCWGWANDSPSVGRRTTWWSMASAASDNVCMPRPRPPAGPTAPKTGSVPKRCGSASSGPPVWAIDSGVAWTRARSPRAACAAGSVTPPDCRSNARPMAHKPSRCC